MVLFMPMMQGLLGEYGERRRDNKGDIHLYCLSGSSPGNNDCLGNELP